MTKTDALTDRALCEAREVCPGRVPYHRTGADNAHRRYIGEWIEVPPAECECCRRIAAALAAAYADGRGDVHEERAWRAAAAELSGAGEEG